MKKRNKISVKMNADNGRELSVLERSMIIKSKFGESGIGYNGDQVVLSVSGFLMLDQEDLKTVIEFLQSKII